MRPRRSQKRSQIQRAPPPWRSSPTTTGGSGRWDALCLSWHAAPCTSTHAHDVLWSTAEQDVAGAISLGLCKLQRFASWML